MDKFIGTVEVRSSTGYDVLSGASGGFVNVICLLDSEREFEALVRSTMCEYHLDVVDIKDVGPVEERILRNDLIPELIVLADALTEEYPIQFDEFQTYKETEDSEMDQ